MRGSCAFRKQSAQLSAELVPGLVTELVPGLVTGLKSRAAMGSGGLLGEGLLLSYQQAKPSSYISCSLSRSSCPKRKSKGLNTGLAVR